MTTWEAKRYIAAAGSKVDGAVEAFFDLRTSGDTISSAMRKVTRAFHLSVLEQEIVLGRVRQDAPA